MTNLIETLGIICGLLSIMFIGHKLTDMDRRIENLEKKLR